MTDFLIKRLPYSLTSNAGLALVGQYIKRLNISTLLDRRFPVKGARKYGVKSQENMGSSLNTVSLT
jgi:hypothetical protein